VKEIAQYLDQANRVTYVQEECMNEGAF